MPVAPVYLNSISAHGCNLERLHLSWNGGFPEGSFACHLIHTPRARAFTAEDEIGKRKFFERVENDEHFLGVQSCQFNGLSHSPRISLNTTAASPQKTDTNTRVLPGRGRGTHFK